MTDTDSPAWLARLGAYGADLDGAMERFMDDVELYQECILLFLDDKSFAALEREIAETDYEGAFADVHALKGVAGNLGLTPMYDAICVMVETLRDHSNVDLAGRCQTILAQRDIVRKIVAD